MECGSYPFFDRSIVPLCLRYMVLSICEVHLHIKVIIYLFHHTAKLSVAVYCLYHKSGLIIVSEDLVKCTIVLIVLLGVHWYQASELDRPINCGQHAAFVHVHGVHAQLDIVMFHN